MLNSIQIQSYQDFTRSFSKPILLQRNAFIQVLKSRSLSSGEEIILYVHEIPSLTRSAHDDLYYEFRKWLQFQSDEMDQYRERPKVGVMTFSHMFVKVEDEMEGDGDDGSVSTRRYYLCVEDNKYIPIKDMSFEETGFLNIGKWFLQGVRTLDWLNKKHGFVMKNIHPNSVVIDRNGKLIFSMPGIGFENWINLIMNDDGLEEYVAIEVDENGKFSEKSDIYSFGKIFLQLFFSDEFGEVSDEKRKKYPKFIGLLEKCIEDEPSDRISYKKLIQELDLLFKPEDGKDIPPPPSSESLSIPKPHKPSYGKKKTKRNRKSNQYVDSVLMNALKSSNLEKRAIVLNDSDSDSDSDDDFKDNDERKKEEKTVMDYVARPVKMPEVLEKDVINVGRGKVVLLGESSVGKSSLVTRFVKGEFNEYSESTVGAAFMSQEVPFDQEKSIKLDVWDTAGQERYRSITPMYYRGSEGALVVYDITSKSSFEKAKSWAQELQKTNESIIICFVGNKIDLGAKREVKEEEARNYCRKNGYIWYEASAKSGENVKEIFLELSKKIGEKKEESISEHQEYDSINISLFDAENKKSCCIGGGIFDGFSLSGLFSSQKRNHENSKSTQKKVQRKVEKKVENKNKTKIIEGQHIVSIPKKVDFVEEGLKKKRKYETLKIIGQGGQSSVFLCKEKKTEKQYTMKKYKPGSEEQEFEFEVSALKRLGENNLENVVKFYDSFEYTDNYGDRNKFIVMEYCEGGDLGQYIRKEKRRQTRKAKNNNNIIIDYSLINGLIRDIILGVVGIHSLDLVHHDIKPANIFMTKEKKIKIGDFGFCFGEKEIQNNDGKVIKGGTMKYMSKEQLSGVFGKPFLDVWSVGCVIFDLLLVKSKIMDFKKIENVNEAISNLLDNKDLKNLIISCMEIDPYKRKSMKEILDEFQKNLEVNDKKPENETEKKQKDVDIETEGVTV